MGRPAFYLFKTPPHPLKHFFQRTTQLDDPLEPAAARAQRRTGCEGVKHARRGNAPYRKLPTLVVSDSEMTPEQLAAYEALKAASAAYEAAMGLSVQVGA